MVTEAKNAQKGKIYRRTRSQAEISKVAYVRRLERRAAKRGLTGREVYLLRDLRNPDMVLLRRVMRFRLEGETRYSEMVHFVVVPPLFRLRAVKAKPTRKT